MKGKADKKLSLGFAQDLPSFNDGRWFHGCGFFINGDHEIVSNYAVNEIFRIIKFGFLAFF